MYEGANRGAERYSPAAPETVLKFNWAPADATSHTLDGDRYEFLRAITTTSRSHHRPDANVRDDRLRFVRSYKAAALSVPGSLW